MRTTRFKSLREMTRALSGDPGAEAEINQHLRQRTLITKLVAIRLAKGLTQAEVAASMGFSQSRVSKFESAEDADLQFGMIVSYCKAVGVRLDLAISNHDAKAVDRVKRHALGIKREMDQLAELAKAGDGAIAQGIVGFYGEAIFNLLAMVRRFQDQMGQLPLANQSTQDEPIDVDSSGVDELTGEESARPITSLAMGVD